MKVLCIGGPLDGELIESEGQYAIRALDNRTTDMWDGVGEIRVPVVTYTLEKFAWGKTVWMMLYISEKLSPAERDTAVFRALVRPELHELATVRG